MSHSYIERVRVIRRSIRRRYNLSFHLQSTPGLFFDKRVIPFGRIYNRRPKHRFGRFAPINYGWL